MAVNNVLNLNNASGSDVVVLNATNSVANVQNNSTHQGYLQDLTILPLSGNNVLSSGGASTAKLDNTYVDANGQVQTSYVYTLLVSRPGSLFPVMSVGELLDFKSFSYPPVTVTKSAADNMNKALSFCQNIMTAPSSKMAVAFQAVMTTAFESGTITAAEAKIADFFNTYPPFKGLDFPSYVAVSTWMQAYAYIWGMNAKGQPGQTFYIYSAPAEGQSGTTSEGTITFTANPNPPNPADPTDRQSGMTITLTPTSGPDTKLTFVSGQLTDGAEGAVALNCSWGYRGTFTGSGSDTTVIPILAGTLLIKKVMAIPIAPESGFSKFWSSLSFSKLFGYFMQAMGLWMALDFLKQKLTAKDDKLADDKGNENKGDDPTSDQVDKAKESGDAVGEKALAESKAKADQVSPDDPPNVPEDDAAFDSAVNDVRADGTAALDQVATDNVSGGIDSASTQIQELAEIEMTPSLNTAATDLEGASQALQDGDLSAATSGLGDVNEALPKALDELGEQVDASMKAQVDEAIEAQSEAAEVAEETSKNSDATETGDEEPFDDPVIPEM